MSGVSQHGIALATLLLRVLQPQGMAGIAHQHVWDTRAAAHMYTQAAHLHMQWPPSLPVLGPSEPKM